MLKWIISGVVVGAAAAGAYVFGERQGGRKVARQLRTDRDFGRQVMEFLAKEHGAKLEYFDMPGVPAEEPPR